MCQLPPGKRQGQKPPQEEIWPQLPSPPVSVSRKHSSNRSDIGAVNPECHPTPELINDSSEHLEPFTPQSPKGSRERASKRSSSFAGSRWTFWGVLTCRGRLFSFPFETVVMVTDGFTFGCSINKKAF